MNISRLLLKFVLSSLKKLNQQLGNMKEDDKVTAQKMAKMILENPVCPLAENIQNILCYITDNKDRFPAAANLMEDILQNLCDAVESDQLIY